MADHRSTDIHALGLALLPGKQRRHALRAQSSRGQRPHARVARSSQTSLARTRVARERVSEAAAARGPVEMERTTHASEQRDHRTALLLGTIAGAVDAAGFTCLDGLLPSHLTASLVVLSASIGERDSVELSARFAMIPVFVASVAGVRWLARTLSARRIPVLQSLLLLLSLGLALFFALGLLFDGLLSDHPRGLLVVGGLGVASMAVQNATMRLALPKLSPTTVMTGNLTQVVMATADLLTLRVRKVAASERAELSARFASAGPPLLGFVCGSALCGYLGSRYGLACLAIPAALSVLTMLLVTRDEATRDKATRDKARRREKRRAARATAGLLLRVALP